MISERRIWRLSALVTSVLLVCSALTNLFWEEAVPFEITLFLFGGLISLGVGMTIVNPRTSPTLLSETEKARFRRSQIIVGFSLGFILVLIMALTGLHRSLLSWLFYPVIALPFVLAIREYRISG